MSDDETDGAPTPPIDPGFGKKKNFTTKASRMVFESAEARERMHRAIAAMGETPAIVPGYNALSHQAETAQHTARMSDTLEAVLEAMAASVDLAEQTRQDNVEAQHFTRRMSVTSLCVSIASLAAAIAAVVFSIH